MLLRRGGGDGGSPQTTVWKVTLFFVVAAIWLTGVRIGSDLVTLVALVLLLVGLVVGWVLGRAERGEEEEGE